MLCLSYSHWWLAEQYNIMAVTMEFNLTATFPLVAWKHIWSYELKLKKNKLGLTVGGLILRVICCLHCMISTLFLLQHFELQFHCSAASSQRVSSHFFKYLRCLFFFTSCISVTSAGCQWWRVGWPGIWGWLWGNNAAYFRNRPHAEEPNSTKFLFF